MSHISGKLPDDLHHYPPQAAYKRLSFNFSTYLTIVTVLIELCTAGSPLALKIEQRFGCTIALGDKSMNF
jgi:hypothetical protein